MTSSAKYIKTDTPGVYRRGKMFIAGWREDGVKKWRRFSTYEAACVFRRDYVLPFRERQALPPTVAAPSGLRGRGFVYFIQSKAPDGHVKVGWSQDVARRISTLTTAHPFGVDLVGLIPGPRSLEAKLHERFAHHRLGGEWFSREIIGDLTAFVHQDIGVIPVSSVVENG